jgi:hypothetical protein
MKALVRLLTAVAISLVPLSAFAQLPNPPQPVPAVVRLGCFSPQPYKTMSHSSTTTLEIRGAMRWRSSGSMCSV